MAELKFSPPEIFYLFGVFHGFFLSIYLLIGIKKHQTNVFLAALLLLFSFYLFENAMYSAGYIRNFPNLIYTSLPLIYLIGPLFFLYTRSSTKQNFRFKPGDILHLFPFLFEFVILIPFYRLPVNQKVALYDLAVSGDFQFQANVYFLGYLIYLASSVIYFLLSYRLTTLFSGAQEPRMKWIRIFSSIFSTYLILSVALSMISWSSASLRSIAFHTNLIAQSLIIQLVGYIPFIHPEALSALRKIRQTTKYQLSGLDSATLDIYQNKLLNVMQNDKPYLDCGLTPELLARRIGITKHQLSQLLTVRLQCNFYDFINKYRVDNAIALIQTPEYRNAKILHLGLDCGFSNKSTFLRSFKKLTGVTPSEFKNNMTKEVPLN